MENLRKKLKNEHETPNASNQSPTGADTGTRLVDNLQPSSSLDDRRETNAVDENRHRYHESLDVEKLDNSSSSALLLQYKNSVRKYLDEELNKFQRINDNYNHELLLRENRIKQLTVENEKLKNENDEDKIVIDKYQHKIIDLELRLCNFNAADLNEDCLNLVFSYLSLDDMIQVKNVCKQWRQASQHWFQQLQTLFVIVDYIGNRIWKFHKKCFKRKIGAGTGMKKLSLILRLYGHHIKYYKLHYEKQGYPNDVFERFLYQVVPKFCENIVEVEIQRHSPHRPSDFEVMATHWKKLEKLHIENLSRLVGKNIHDLLRNNQQLKTLKFQFENGVSCPMSLEFFTYLPTIIEEIDISMMFNIREEQFDYFISASKTFTLLRSLKLAVLDSLSINTITAIANIKSLMHLNVSHVYHFKPDRWAIDAITNLKGLKSLYLLNNYDLREDSFINIVESCIQLEVIDIFKWKYLTDKGMAAIAKLKKLKILRIYPHDLTSGSIVNLPKSLEVFVCGESEIYNIDAIKLLENATNLRFVEFSICNNLTKDVLKAANKIANGRKNNILCISEFRFCVDFGDIDTPYFKYFENYKNIPLEIFPEDISNHLKLFLSL